MEAHLEAMVEVFSLCRRVLRKDGTMWMNYGDCYACAPNGRKAADIVGDDRCFRDKPFSTVTNGRRNASGGAQIAGEGRFAAANLKPKDLVMMPHRVAMALQADGWYVRQDIVWYKLNPMPESCQDRPTRSHEYVFLLTRSERYFYDADAIRERTGNEMGSDEYSAQCKKWEYDATLRGKQHSGNGKHDGGRTHPAGRNKRSVWTLASQSFSGAHFATFPEALVEPCILAGTSERGCCPHCGAPWDRVVEREPGFPAREQDIGGGMTRRTGAATNYAYRGIGIARGKQKGWAPTCLCPHAEADCVPCVCLDPFGGSGTVGLVATRLGRRSILIELNPEYVSIAEERNAQMGLGL